MLPMEERIFLPEDLKCKTSLSDTSMFECAYPQGGKLDDFVFVGLGLWKDQSEVLNKCIEELERSEARKP